MSTIHTEITLKNAVDEALVMAGIVKEYEVRQTTVEVLLGAIPLEALDLIVNPRKVELVGAHGEQPLHSVKREARPVRA